ncbi:Hypothetical protein IALB_2419 [Ignavibacterium album JCM 16511]|uniref:Uncharacterized protein n=1 Tax=Ignavibacterium album (strain DSM 19864 / JCM 16511 / NBRC 101810 / Mat9-16) TaxID=945713 RepID=I0AMB5_IGNAJ|nr:hypothetical protein [Ignavibacterium album]AFH50122.1 Hypothetical protein IALB_2419 [Ignavibacterium album JCM 16511]
MKAIKLVVLVSLFFLFCNQAQSQPFIYFDKTISDSAFHRFAKICKLDLSTGVVTDFLPEKYDPYIVNDPTQSFMLVNQRNWSPELYNTNDSINFLLLDHFFGIGIDEMLYSPQHNSLFFLTDGYKYLEIYNLSTHTFSNRINLGKTAYTNFYMEPSRSAFFSSDNDKIYIFVVDSNDIEQVWTFSINDNQIIEKRNLLELGGYQGSLGYSLTFGKKGKGIIESYPPYYNNNNRQYYFRLCDFENIKKYYPFIIKTGECEAYFNGNGEFIIVADETYYNQNDSIDNYQNGNFTIYNSSTGQLVKTITLPPRGVIYTFDNYPNDIYYVLNLDTQPEIYNLTKLELHQLSPAVALTSPFGSRQEFSFNVTAYGGLFTDSSVAYFNGQAKPTSKINDTTVSFTLSNTDIASTGNYPIWISNYGSYSDTLNFSVTYSLQNSLSPTFQCVRRNPDKSYTAYFGYNNNNSYDVFIPTGVNNRFSPSPEFRGQANVFISGNHQNVFTVNFNGDNLTWYLAGQSITVNKNSSSCP